MRKFRISAHGSLDNWYCIQQKTWYGWTTIIKYISCAEKAKEMIKVMQESDQ